MRRSATVMVTKVLTLACCLGVVTSAMATASSLGGIATLARPRTLALAQENQGDGLEREELLRSTEIELPGVPAFLRLLRITLEPGAVSVNHTHPGPEFGRLEVGELTVHVEGGATLRRAGDDGQAGPPEPAPEGEDFQMQPGDQITYPTGTAMEFRNQGDDPAVILAAVLLPAGNQRPPSIDYPDGTPAADAFEGVSFFILGDAVATDLPPDTAVVAIERLTIGDGAPLPGYAGAALISLESGTLDVTVEAGEVQVYRGETAALRPEVAEGENLSLVPGDALYFPRGLAAADRVEGSGQLVVVRLGTGPEGTDPAATPAGEAAAVLAVNTPVGGFPTPTPTPVVATPEADDVISEGDTVVVTTDSVNLRAGPSTASDIQAVLTIGEQLLVTGPSEEADGFVWYPVEVVGSADLLGITGFIAADFIEPLEG